MATITGPALRSTPRWLLLPALASLGCAEILGVGDFDDATATTETSTGSGGASGGSGGSSTGGQAGAGGGSEITPSLGWIAHVAGSDDEQVWAHDIDPNGEFGLCGPFKSSLTVETAGGSTQEINSIGPQDFYVLKLEPDGSVKWLRQVSSSGEIDCSGLAFDAQARTHFTGSIVGIVDFVGTPIDAGGNRAAYLAVLDDDGQPWRVSRLTGAGDQGTFDMDVDPNHTHWVAGAFRGTASFGGTTLESSASERAGFAASETYPGDPHLVGIGADGTDDYEEQYAFAVHAPSSGRIWVGGRNTATLAVDGHQAVTESPEGNAFVASIDNTGALTRIMGLGSPDLSQVHALATRPDGALIVAGLFTSTLSVNGTPELVGYGDWNGFILELTDDWSVGWALQLGEAGAQEVRDVAVDAQGNLYAVVNFAGTIDVGGQSLTAAGSTDGLLLCLDAQGHHRFHVWLASEGEVFVSSVAADPSTSRIGVAGHFGDTLTLWHGDVQLGAPLPARGAMDGFVASFDLP